MIIVAYSWFYRHSGLVTEVLGEWRQPTHALRARQGYLVCACGTATSDETPKAARVATLKHMAGCTEAQKALEIGVPDVFRRRGLRSV